MNDGVNNPEQLASQLHDIAIKLRAAGRNDLILSALGSHMLDELKAEAARGKLSRLVITSDYRFLLPDLGNVEVDLQPVHKAVYLLFLNHPEGIEFKHLSEYKDELRQWYRKTAKMMDLGKIEESVVHLTNPLDNAINEKCSRIKRAFLDVMDEYSASYYIISGHARIDSPTTTKTWYKRLKVINLPRYLVVFKAQGRKCQGLIVPLIFIMRRSSIFSTWTV